MLSADLGTPPMEPATPAQEIWRRGNRVPLWRYRLETRLIRAVWPALRRIWRGF